MLRSSHGQAWLMFEPLGTHQGKQNGAEWQQGLQERVLFLQDRQEGAWLCGAPSVVMMCFCPESHNLRAGTAACGPLGVIPSSAWHHLRPGEKPRRLAPSWVHAEGGAHSMVAGALCLSMTLKSEKHCPPGSSLLGGPRQFPMPCLPLSAQEAPNIQAAPVGRGNRFYFQCTLICRLFLLPHTHRQVRKGKRDCLMFGLRFLSWKRKAKISKSGLSSSEVFAGICRGKAGSACSEGKEQMGCMT